MMDNPRHYEHEIVKIVSTLSIMSTDENLPQAIQAALSAASNKAHHALCLITAEIRKERNES